MMPSLSVSILKKAAYASYEQNTHVNALLFHLHTATPYRDTEGAPVLARCHSGKWET